MGALSKSADIIRNYGFKGYIHAINRFIFWHPFIDETWWQLNRLVRSRRRVIGNVQGYKIFLDIAENGIEKYLFLYGCWEPECTRIFKEMLPKGAKVLELGANIGYYALLAARSAERVYAIEPEPQNAALLRKNVTLNLWDDRIEVYELAASDSIGKASLYVSENRTMAKLAELSDSPEGSYIDIETTTIDEFLKDEEVDVIRMDVEGAEWFIIKGMRNILEGIKPLILIIEVHPNFIRNYGGDPIVMLNRLLDSGFKIKYLVKSQRESSISIRRCMKGIAYPPQQTISFPMPLHDPIDYLGQFLPDDESLQYSLFMER